MISHETRLHSCFEEVLTVGGKRFRPEARSTASTASAKDEFQWLAFKPSSSDHDVGLTWYHKALERCVVRYTGIGNHKGAEANPLFSRQVACQASWCKMGCGARRKGPLDVASWLAHAQDYLGEMGRDANGGWRADYPAAAMQEGD